MTVEGQLYSPKGRGLNKMGSSDGSRLIYIMPVNLSKGGKHGVKVI